MVGSCRVKGASFAFWFRYACLLFESCMSIYTPLIKNTLASPKEKISTLDGSL